ncbi:hypothetical protein [Pontibacter liquoris]|uniref:hypothetical protein n=1 Tax=Pontibacter liquoris TaxID=2905677 RepID=UPI001FA80CFA|nr:hypothetical protein [Pontibacter liquoris]
MKRKTVSGRDVRIFLLGMLAMFLIVLAFDWRDAKRGFMDGLNGSAYNYKEAAVSK